MHIKANSRNLENHVRKLYTAPAGKGHWKDNLKSVTFGAKTSKWDRSAVGH